MTDQVPAKSPRSLEPFFGRDPFRQFRTEMDDLLSKFTSGWGDNVFSSQSLPSLDLSESEDKLEVHMDVPGLKPEEINIEISGNTLRVSGEKKEEKEEKDKTFHRVERRRGHFSRSVTLPCAVQEDKVAAECRDGVLNITLPKVEEAKSHKIPVSGSKG